MGPGGTAVLLWRRLFAGAGGIGSGIALVACLFFFDDARCTLRQSVVILSAVHVVVGAPVIVAALKRARMPSLPARVRAFAMTSGMETARHRPISPIRRRASRR